MESLFKYCPRCGRSALKAASEKSVLCPKCHFEYFFNAAGAVAALIVNERNELLVTIRKYKPGKGLWDLPGGFIDPGETAEQALKREVREELNLTIESLTYLTSAANTYDYKQITYSTVDIAFICRVRHFETLQPGSDVESAMFVNAAQIQQATFAFNSIHLFVTTFIAQEKIT